MRSDDMKMTIPPALPVLRMVVTRIFVTRNSAGNKSRHAGVILPEASANSQTRPATPRGFGRAVGDRGKPRMTMVAIKGNVV